MSKSGQQPSKADTGGQRTKPEKAKADEKDSAGKGAAKPMPPSSGKSGAKKG